MRGEKSKEWYSRALKVMPGGVNSPVRAFKSVGGHPIFMHRGNAAFLYDIDGYEYLDFCCSWGPLISGHNHPEIMNAVHYALRDGTTFGTCHSGEVKIAEFITERHRYIDKIRFVSSGTEAVMSALRLARGATGRARILKFEGCYHGHVDALMVKAGSGLVTFGISTSAGVTETVARDTIVVPLNDNESLIQAFELYGYELAAAIIEPIPANNGLLLQDRSFLVLLRELCTHYGALLIFDEVISGFRIGFQGAAGYYQINPDIITLGKIIGGGFPVGAYGGSQPIMDMVAPLGPVYQAGTLSGNPVAMAAGLAQLKLCTVPCFYENLEEKTAAFLDAIRRHLNTDWPVHLHHIQSVFWISFGRDSKIQNAGQIDPASMNYFNRFFHLILDEGIYIGPSGYEVGFISSVHSDTDLHKAADVISKALCKVFDS